MKIDVRKLNPWNWFKHEDAGEYTQIPVRRQGGGDGGSVPAMFPESPLWNIHREVDRLFGDVLSRLGGGGLPFGAAQLPAGLPLKPDVDIRESKEKYEITVEIPGVESEDMTLELVDGALVLGGEKKHRKEDKGEHVHTIERAYGAFRRVLSLPHDADAEGIDAKFRNGVLTIIVPRKEAAGTGGGKVIKIDHAA